MAGSGTTVQTTNLPFGWLVYLGTGASVLVCYGKTFLLSSAGLVGFSVADFNPHVQAVVMWVLGLIAIYGLHRDRRAHGRNYPLVLGISGVGLIILTVYTYYSPTVEMSGYILLIAAALLNQNAMLQQLKQDVELQAANLEQRVEHQVAELNRIGQLKRFLSPEVAQMVVEGQDASLLESHRRYVASLFCDLRGFTAFSERAEPEEVIDVLRLYHQTLGRLVHDSGGTIDHRAGDGLMVIFNDPLPCEEPVREAIEMAFRMNEAVQELCREWARLGHDLGFGIGIAAGYATLGLVGDENRSDYTAIGNVINLSSRLCDKAKDGEILLSHRAYLDVEGKVSAEAVGDLSLKGVSRPQEVYRIRFPDAPREPRDAQDKAE